MNLSQANTMIKTPEILQYSMDILFGVTPPEILVLSPLTHNCNIVFTRFLIAHVVMPRQSHWRRYFLHVSRVKAKNEISNSNTYLEIPNASKFSCHSGKTRFFQMAPNIFGLGRVLRMDTFSSLAVLEMSNHPWLAL